MLGFKRAYQYRATRSAEKIVEYEMVEGDRSLSVQLWGDGGHRVSHTFKGRGITTPTNFRTVSEMRTAINHERTREHRSDLG